VRATFFNLIDQQKTHEVPASVAGDEVRITPAAVALTLGWKLEARGLCRRGTCIPTAGVPGLVNGQGIDLRAFADLLERPLALDVENRVAALAAPAPERARALTSLEAPDFTLPDLQGRLHSLSEHRGKKVLLLAHASW
jgi:hypothetical protein